MSATSLEHKTIRPGSLTGYSYYHSDRRPASAGQAVAHRQITAAKSKGLLVVVVLIVLGVFVVGRGGHKPARHTTAVSKTSAISTNTNQPKTTPVAAAPAPTNHCASNQLNQLVLVSITQRHLWACQGTKQLYDSPVITGNQLHDATLTPPGTYHIYAKQTNQTLTGSDVTGSWNDPVQYWMPFLNNVYGTYGFHDATWRADNAFGNIDPASDDASHGCVELPLATSKWLYDWTQVGTTVTIES